MCLRIASTHFGDCIGWTNSWRDSFVIDWAIPTIRMGVYKLSIMDLDPKCAKSPQDFPKSSFLRGNAITFMGRRLSTKVEPKVELKMEPKLRNFLETPDQERIAPVDPVSSSSEDDSCSSSQFTASSTRTSNATRASNALTSDDDACLRELSLRGVFDNSFVAMARHSTACCTDRAVRQELLRKFHLEDDGPARTPVRNSFAIRPCSFRRELDTTEDRVESLALWEETTESWSTSARDRVVRKDDHAPHSWPHRQSPGPSLGFGKLGLDSLFRKPKKAKSSFFNGFFSGLSFSSSRRSRKW